MELNSRGISKIEDCFMQKTHFRIFLFFGVKKYNFFNYFYSGLQSKSL